MSIARYAPAPLLLALAACATPQERCIRDATRDLRTVNALIAESEATLARGYAIVEEQRLVHVGFGYCIGGRGRVGYRFCGETYPTTVRRPAAVDLDAERRKLAGLRGKAEELERAAGPAVAQCQAGGAG